MIRLTSFQGKTVAVFGLGGSGLVAAEALIAGGATVVAWDDNPNAQEAARQAGLDVVDLNDADWSGFDSFVVFCDGLICSPFQSWMEKSGKMREILTDKICVA